MGRLWQRLWGRGWSEDVAFVALMLSNLDEAALGLNPWAVLAVCTRGSEQADALLLSIEEMLRAGRAMPSEEMLLEWCEGRAVDAHMALLVSYAGSVRGHTASEELLDRLSAIEIPAGDALLGRVMQRLRDGQAHV